MLTVYGDGDNIILPENGGVIFINPKTAFADDNIAYEWRRQQHTAGYAVRTVRIAGTTYWRVWRRCGTNPGIITAAGGMGYGAEGLERRARLDALAAEFGMSRAAFLRALADGELEVIKK